MRRGCSSGIFVLTQLCGALWPPALRWKIGWQACVERRLGAPDGTERCATPCFLVRVSELLRERATLCVTASSQALGLFDRRSPRFFEFLRWFCPAPEGATGCLRAALCSNRLRSPVAANWHHACPRAHAQSPRERIRLLRSRGTCPPAGPLSRVPQFVFPASLLLSRVGVLGMPS
jgi:hypothetical protein